MATMLKPTVEHGADMEIDLIMGLAKPKSALAEPTTLAETAVPEEAFSAFTALLDGEGTEAPADETATPALPLQMTAAMPQEITLTAPLQEASTPEIATGEPLPIAPDQPLETKETAEVPQGVAQLAPAVTKEERAATVPPAQMPTAQITATPDMAKLEQASTPQTTSPTLFASSAATSIPTPQQRVEAVAAPSQPVPSPHQTTMAPLAQNPVAQPRMEEPRIEMAPRVGPQRAASTTAAQPLAPSLPTFANLETMMDDTEALQFGIKIERQAVDIAPTSRASPQATPPVASQISSQLPQLLSKAEKQTVELRLDPPELGRVTIHLTTNDQQVTAHVIADRPDTVDLMRRHAELLTATLARAGFSQADLSFQQGKGQSHSGSFQQFQNLEVVSEGEVATPVAPTITGLDGRLDIRL